MIHVTGDSFCCAWGMLSQHRKWIDDSICCWLVVWNINFIFPLILGMSSSQLTHIFQRGGPTTNQEVIFMAFPQGFFDAHRIWFSGMDHRQSMRIFIAQKNIEKQGFGLLTINIHKLNMELSRVLGVYPKMVGFCEGKSQSNMDDNYRGTPMTQEPPIYHLHLPRSTKARGYPKWCENLEVGSTSLSGWPRFQGWENSVVSPKWWNPGGK